MCRHSVQCDGNNRSSPVWETVVDPFCRSRPVWDKQAYFMKVWALSTCYHTLEYYEIMKVRFSVPSNIQTFLFLLIWRCSIQVLYSSVRSAVPEVSPQWWKRLRKMAYASGRESVTWGVRNKKTLFLSDSILGLVPVILVWQPAKLCVPASTKLWLKRVTCQPSTLVISLGPVVLQQESMKICN